MKWELFQSFKDPSEQMFSALFVLLDPLLSELLSGHQLTKNIAVSQTFSVTQILCHNLRK